MNTTTTTKARTISRAAQERASRAAHKAARAESEKGISALRTRAAYAEAALLKALQAPAPADVDAAADAAADVARVAAEALQAAEAYAAEAVRHVRAARTVCGLDNLPADDVADVLRVACKEAMTHNRADAARALYPAPEDLTGSAWLILATECTGRAWDVRVTYAARKALYREAWICTGHSVGGTRDMTDADGVAGAGLDETAAVSYRHADGNVNRPTEDAVTRRDEIAGLLDDTTRGHVLSLYAKGYTQGEIADILDIARATVNRTIQKARRAREN